ncbi:hypothetical protein AusDCA_4461 [Desulfitobacterium sp. AusDCA]
MEKSNRQTLGNNAFTKYPLERDESGRIKALNFFKKKVKEIIGLEIGCAQNRPRQEKLNKENNFKLIAFERRSKACPKGQVLLFYLLVSKISFSG